MGSNKLSQPKICPECQKENLWFNGSICQNCYRQNHWKRKLVQCKRCGRMKPNHAKGYCPGCYNSMFHLDKNKQYNYFKWYGLDIETYRKITKECAICGFDKFVALHHLDKNHNNNSSSNLVGLCPNHHHLIHTLKYKEEMLNELKKKGFNTQENSSSAAIEEHNL